jgi:hypothetical protein
MHRKHLLFVALLLMLALTLTACAGAAGEPGPEGPQGPAGPQGEAGTTGCADCHNETTVIFAANQQWAISNHGSGTSWSYAGARAMCAGCHSHEAFVDMIEAGISPNAVETAPAVPSNANCRTCHQIHNTYTAEDWALTTTEAVVLFALEDATYDGGKGNLCTNCHQPMSAIAAADGEGNIEVTSTYWGPHHGPQSAMLLGLGGGGEVVGTASPHAAIGDTCVSCHISNMDHTFAPVVASCTACHPDAEDFDLNGLQTEVQALLDELLVLLEDAGMYHDGHPVEGTYEAAKAQALWNYIFIANEDASLGVHNPSYTKALLEASLDAFTTE